MRAYLPVLGAIGTTMVGILRMSRPRVTGDGRLRGCRLASEEPRNIRAGVVNRDRIPRVPLSQAPCSPGWSGFAGSVGLQALSMSPPPEVMEVAQ